MFAQEHAPTHLCSQRPQPGPNTLEDMGGGVNGGHYARHTLGTRGKKIFSRKESGREEMKWGKERGRRREKRQRYQGWEVGLDFPSSGSPPPTQRSLLADSFEAPQMQCWRVRERGKGGRPHRSGNHTSLENELGAAGGGSASLRVGEG